MAEEQNLIDTDPLFFMNEPFVHLHFHTHYSLSEGAISVKKLPDVLRKLNLGACAITDSGNMFGVIEFYSALKIAGIKPIIGTQAFVAVGGRTRQNYIPDERSHFPIVLLCKNRRGYQNLIKLSSLSYTEGMHGGVPRIDDELLKTHSDGLIMLSGGIDCSINRYIQEGKLDDALNEIEFYRSVFRDCFFLELQSDGTPDTDTINRELLGYADRLGIRCVATNGCRYVKKENAYAAHILRLMGRQEKITDPGNERPYTSEFYIKSYDDMAAAFADYPPECIGNTVAIADMCDLDLRKEKDYLPDYACDPGKTPKDQFAADCKVGLEKRLEKLSVVYQWNDDEKQIQTKRYFDRLAYEAGVITDKDYPGYFLIVADFVKWAKNNGVSVGPGRGSGAGSIAAYAMNITDVDPMRYGLLFERFLNPERVSMPDFDIDFEASGRDRVIDYVRRRYGDDNVCQISAIGSLQAKGAIRGVARVMGIGYAEADAVVKLIPPDYSFTLNGSLDTAPELKEMLLDGTDTERSLLNVAMELEGSGSNLTTHAAGVIIMNSNVTDYMPVCLSPQGVRQSQYTMEYAEKQGAVKFDFLGLRNLSIIDKALALIKENGKTVPDVANLNFLDERVFEMLKRGDSVGVFQLESSGMKKLLRKLKPDTFEDIVALIALYRPGPLGSGMIDDYINRKRGTQTVEYLHPAMTDVLEETYGVMVYQEQVMRVAQVMGGFSLGQADELRRAIGKKKPEILARQKDIFVKGSTANGIDIAVAEQVFDLIDKFAGYGFNKSHSVAYAVIGFQTAYLKVHFPVEFMCALMSVNSKNADEVVNLVRQCRIMKITVLPPDINKSELSFGVEGDAIRFGLSAVKSVGDAALEILIGSRQKDHVFLTAEAYFSSLKQTVSSAILEGLIKCGAFDSIHPNRRELFEGIASITNFIAGVLKFSEGAQNSLLDELADGGENAEAAYSLDLPSVKDWQMTMRLTHEQEIIGMALSGHFLDGCVAEYEQIPHLKNYIQLEAAAQSPSDSYQEGERTVSFLCVITSIKVKLTKKGNRFALMTIEDKWGELEAVAWSETYDRLSQKLRLHKPVILEGKIKFDGDALRFVLDDAIPLSAYRPGHVKYIKITGNHFTPPRMKSFTDTFADTSGSGIGLLLEIPYKERYTFVMDTAVQLQRTEAMFDSLEDRFDAAHCRFMYSANQNFVRKEEAIPEPKISPEKKPTAKRTDGLPEVVLVTDMGITL